MATQFTDFTRTEIEEEDLAKKRFEKFLKKRHADVFAFHVGEKEELEERLKDLPVREEKEG